LSRRSGKRNRRKKRRSFRRVKAALRDNFEHPEFLRVLFFALEGKVYGRSHGVRSCGIPPFAKNAMD